MLRRILTGCVLLLALLTARSQDMTAYVKDRAPELQPFYELRSGKPVFLQNKELLVQFSSLLQNAESFALRRVDYKEAIQLLTAGKVQGLKDEQIDEELLFTTALIRFVKELAYGNEAPKLAYEGLKWTSKDRNILEALNDAIGKQGLEQFVEEIQPSTTEYRNLIVHFQLMQERGQSVKDVKVESREVSGTNRPLVSKLYLLGLTDTMDHSWNRTQLLPHLKNAQSLFDIMRDGSIRPNLLRALNVAVAERMQELRKAINIYRWCSALRAEAPLALVNIPSASLFVYELDSVALFSRLIVGKKETPTPGLSSTIREVIAYPYWTVPHSIATKELLPSIKRNPGFIEANHFQVLNRKGEILDPYKIRWQQYSASYFPFVIRQSTGCDNSLGILKFNFHNPFSVYLHDTPAKGLFVLNKRYFSHGCMRVEQPLALAQYLVPSQRQVIDTLTRFCRLDQEPQTFTAEKKLQIVVLYSTAWFNEEGKTRFYEDIYEKNQFAK